ncbi:MAG: DUF1517 domain-containing protein [Cyanobacteria bacterium J06649_4]
MPKLFFRNRWMRNLITAATTLMVVSGVGVMPKVSFSETAGRPLQVDWQHQTQALAQSGGRSSGGSFGSSGSGSSSSGSSSRSSGSSSGSSYRNSYSSYGNDSYYSGDGEGNIYGLVLLLGVLILFALASEHEKEKDHPQTTVRSEQDNDIVTVTQIQVAMKVEDESVKRSLNKIATELDWRTNFGLNIALRKTIQLLLASPENWTHASGQSTTAYTREQGGRHFEAFSRAERSKFAVTSLVNIDGHIHDDSAGSNSAGLNNAGETVPTVGLPTVGPADSEAAADNNYLVATLILGTAHDHPLLYGIDSADQLFSKLRQLQADSYSYLFKYELLWSPQQEKETLTATELQERYPNLTKIGDLPTHAKLLIRES